jgi:hypothetical protein
MMRLPLMFSDAAKKAFKDAKIDGTFHGIIVEEAEDTEKAYFIHMDPTGRMQKTIWEHAAGSWEGIFRTATRQVR